MSQLATPLIVRDCNGKYINFYQYDIDGVLYESDVINQQEMKLPLLCVFDMIAAHNKTTATEQLVIKVRETYNNMIKIIVSTSFYSGTTQDLMVIRHADVVKTIEEYSGKDYCLDCLLVYATPKIINTLSGESETYKKDRKQLVLLPAVSKLSLPLRYSITFITLFWMIVKFVVRASSLYLFIAGISWYFYGDHTHLSKLIQAYTGPVMLHFVHSTLTGGGGSSDTDI